MLRVAVVNDMRAAVALLRRALESAPGVEVAWIALDGVEAVEKCAGDTPDVILMDLVMPVMNGAEATRRIMRATPCAVLLVTAAPTGNAGLVFEAMGHGALDAVKTPEFLPNGDIRGADELLRKIFMVARLADKPVRDTRLPPPSAPEANGPSLAAVGASTGGPKALARILGDLPAGLDAAVVVVQHVDVRFAGDLADWLDKQCPLRTVAAAEGDELLPGTVYVAATNDHLILASDKHLRYTPEPVDYPYRPSVDAFFKSLAVNWPGRGVAALLTGMGRDGAKGLLALRRLGWRTAAQDQATSVVYGMPKAAAELGAAVEILPLEKIAPFIINHSLRSFDHVRANDRKAG